MNKTNGILNNARRMGFWLVSGVILSASLSAKAAPLNLPIPLYEPNVFASFMDTIYNASTDTLTVDQNSGFFGSLSIGGTGFYGDFSLTASISGGGSGDAILNSGFFSIIASDCDEFFTCVTGDTLLTGNLIDFGYANNGGGVLEFRFTPTGGTLASEYIYGVGDGGIILSASGYGTGAGGLDNFDGDFAGVGFNSFANIAPIPVPAAMWIFGTGLLGLAGIARRKV